VTFKYEPLEHDKWKYILTKDYVVILDKFWTGYEVDTPYVKLKDCVLTIKKGYAWNGLTGFFDGKKWLRASLIHDCLLAENRKKFKFKYTQKVYHAIHSEFRRALSQDTNWWWEKVLYGAVKLVHPIANKYRWDIKWKK
jgi:hypothetical protein